MSVGVTVKIASNEPAKHRMKRKQFESVIVNFQENVATEADLAGDASIFL